MLVKGILINLVLLAVYCALIITNSEAANRGFNIALGAGMCMAAQVAVNVIGGLVFLIMSKRELAKTLLISGGILIPVGFCTWLLLLSIYG